MSLVLTIVGGYLILTVVTALLAGAICRAGTLSDEAQDQARRELMRAAAPAEHDATPTRADAEQHDSTRRQHRRDLRVIAAGWRH